VIQPKVDRREAKSNLSSKNNFYNSKDSIRIPSMSWYIKNWILPKEGKEIQESIKNYLREGGSLNSSSLPKKLISKRKSMKVEDPISFGQNSFNYQDYTAPAYKDYLKNTVKYVDG
jgi:hypothetical protein